MPKSSQDTIPERRTSGRYSYLPWVDLICAGVPCQDWSVAGKRAGLSGTRSSLVYQFARILYELRPTWFLFENVPGLLSSNDGRDFAEVLRLFMVKCGYGIQWRVLDSQFFGVAQRRRRLFIVGRFGKPCPAEILFEPEGGAGDFAQSEEARPDVARAVDDGIASFGWAKSPSQTMRIDERTTDALQSSPNGYPAVAFCRREESPASVGRRADRRSTSSRHPATMQAGGIGQGHNTITYVRRCDRQIRSRASVGERTSAPSTIYDP